MEDIEYYDIPIYNFPYDVEEDDEDTIIDNSELRVCVSHFEGSQNSDLVSEPPSLRYHWFRGRS